ncbi:MAG TPA: ATP synthase F1 subunit epsilon [Spirochaetota bacterium]|jgi:F-type H+-transporting ATPase subunit epsilon|nr:ATP synthase F1 subunit epsilon [Spirochaetota bacterium]HOR92559.1 ATP synthase F1 subunit epsilon [Spirochaetota bacterium]HPD03852.1 ATP synthase F1 subunit epsilon [Spirochaetota bacterium]HPK44745.1 ATP synthase F1 subunit epsilon [Spirochaetota bacterium]HQI37791.1 ATP synthase F1 subunit epsilon [Spirochaetota bacterium]
MALKLNCNVLTPERQIYEGQIDFAVVQAYDGEMGFLYNHAPLISELGTGEIRLRNGDATEYFYVDGGFVEIKNNSLIILAQEAAMKGELRADLLEAKIKEISALPRPERYAERLTIDIELKKLKARLQIAKK